MKNRDGIANSLRTSVMLGTFAFGIMPFVLPIYAKSMGGSAEAIGGLFSVVSFVTLLLRPVFGKLSDGAGRRGFFVASFVVYALAMALYSFATNLQLLYLARVVQGIGGSLMWTSAYAIVSDITKKKDRGKSMGRLEGADAAGRFYGAVVGFLVLSYFSLVTGWSVMFKAYALVSLYGAYLAFRYVPETRTAKGSPMKNSARNSVRNSERNSERNSKRRSMPAGGARTVHGMTLHESTSVKSRFSRLLTVVLLSSISASMLSPLLMVFLQDKFPTKVSTLAIAFVPAAIVYAYLPSRVGVISDRINRAVPMAIGLVASGVVSFGFPYCPNISVLAVLWVLESIGIVIASPAEAALVSDLTGENHRGSAYGWYLSAASLGGVMGPLLGGWLYDAYNHSLPFYVNGVVLVIDGVLALVLLRNTTRRKGGKVATEL